MCFFDSSMQMSDVQHLFHLYYFLPGHFTTKNQSEICLWFFLFMWIDLFEIDTKHSISMELLTDEQKNLSFMLTMLWFSYSLKSAQWKRKRERESDRQNWDFSYQTHPHTYIVNWKHVTEENLPKIIRHSCDETNFIPDERWKKIRIRQINHT